MRKLLKLEPLKCLVHVLRHFSFKFVFYMFCRVLSIYKTTGTVALIALFLSFLLLSFIIKKALIFSQFPLPGNYLVIVFVKQADEETKENYYAAIGWLRHGIPNST